MNRRKATANIRFGVIRWPQYSTIIKLLAFLFLFFIINACSNKVDTKFIPKEFDYSDDKIGYGKTFIYKNFNTSEETFKELGIDNYQRSSIVINCC